MHINVYRLKWYDSWYIVTQGMLHVWDCGIYLHNNNASWEMVIFLHTSTDIETDSSIVR